MSVLLDTTLGEIVIDLFVDDCPLATKNFLKLCKIKYYNNVLFFNVQENFMVQTGDPTGTGNGGTSIYGLMYGDQAKFFDDEIKPHLKHGNRKGLVAMASHGNEPNTNGSQFYITTRADDMEYLDGKHTLFGEVAEGMDVLDKINALFVDKDYRPYQDVRIKHTYVLDDPFPDPDLLASLIPDQSPLRDRPVDETVDARLPADEQLDDTALDGRTEEEIEQSLREKEAKSRAVVLEMIGDLPDADVKPPEEVLFVCKLNPVTESADLDMAFCRFGPCKSEVIRDFKTGDSLCYAFVEFTDKRHCEEAYFKMNNVLLDDRRIKVDFSQSVSKLWNQFKRRPWEQRKEEKHEEDKKNETLMLKSKHHKRNDGFDLVEEEEPTRDRHQRRQDDRERRAKSRSRDRKRRSLDREHSSRRRSRSSSPKRSRHDRPTRNRSKSRSRSSRRRERDRRDRRDDSRDRRRDRDRQ